MIVADACAVFAMVSGSCEGEGMRALMLEGEQIIAPSLLKYELLNVVRKYVEHEWVSAEGALDWYETGLSLVNEFVDFDDLAAETLSESIRLNHPAYDIAYLVLARRNAATLMTLDKRLAKVCVATGVSCFKVISLE